MVTNVQKKKKKKWRRRRSKEERDCVLIITGNFGTELKNIFR